MRTITKPVYQCEFCRKIYQREKACIDHEPKCNKNPVNDRDCFYCQNLEKKEVDYYYDSYRGEEFTKVNVFYCKKIDSFLYPPVIEHRYGCGYEFGDKDNQPMKKGCELFDDGLGDLTSIKEYCEVFNG